MIRRFSLVVILVVAACRSQERARVIPGHEDYRVRQEVALSTAGLGDGRLQILEDARISPLIRGSFQRGVPEEACSRPPSDSVRVFCTDISRRTLRPAILRLADTTEAELDATPLDRPIADIVLAMPAVPPEPAIYGVSVDLTAPMGSYSGPILELLDVRARRLTRVQARDAASDSLVDILLPTTLKTGWRILPAPDGQHHDILLVACRPGLSTKAGGFTVTYTRFSVENGQWRRHQLTTRGFWENDGQFPDRSRFP